MGKPDHLSPEELEIIREALLAAVRGPYFPEWEFGTLIGRTRDEVASILASWPATDDPTSQDVAVNNVLLNLLGYPHGEDAALIRDVPAGPNKIRSVLERWRSV
jgi:hypothetical protein